MAIDFTDVYQVREFIKELQKKHIDIEDEPMEMGIFGYLGDIHSNILQNSAQVAAENSLEALPTKSKYARNVLIHANTLGLVNEAVPATMNVVLYLNEAGVENSLRGDSTFVLDRDITFDIGDYPFMLEYDIILKRVVMQDKSIVYTAMYDMSERNPISNIYTPYIQTVGRLNISGTDIIAIQTQVRQYKHYQDEKKLYTENPLENKSFLFEYNDQLAYFTIKVEEGEEVHNLLPVYDGLIDQVTDEYINYSYLGDNTIRCLFNKASYQPRTNSVITIDYYTTKGTLGNIRYEKNIRFDLKSERFKYNDVWCIMKPLSSAFQGEDTKSTEELQKIIPAEALARGTITNTTDLDNFFNTINTSNRKIYFVKKIDSIKRVYYAYVAMKYNNLVFPTNTIDMTLTRTQFDLIQQANYILLPGNCIYYNRSNDGEVVTNQLYKLDQVELYKKNGFLYFNPFMMVINKNPFYISYLINYMSVTRGVEFSYINQTSPIQYILNDIEWKRQHFTAKNYYTLTFNLTSNIMEDTVYRIFTTTDDYGDPNQNFRVFAVLRNEDGNFCRWTYGEILNYSRNIGNIECRFTFETDNIMDASMNLKIINTFDLNSTFIMEGYFPEVLHLDIFICVKYDQYDYGGRTIIGEIVPGLEGWTCCNQYKISEGVPLYYNYSQVMSTFIDVTEATDNNLSYNIKKVPVIAYDYINSEAKLNNFIEQLELVRSYILYKLANLEDGFGVDIKFFNTYGPAKFFNVDGAYLDNVSLSLNFRVRPKPGATEGYINDILVFVRDYVQDFDQLGDLDFPNLQTAVKNKFADQILYFEYRSFNMYGPGDQHIHREEFEIDITKVPELLSIRITKNDLPDINIEEITY